MIVIAVLLRLLHADAIASGRLALARHAACGNLWPHRADSLQHDMDVYEGMIDAVPPGLDILTRVQVYDAVRAIAARLRADTAELERLLAAIPEPGATLCARGVFAQ
jgi:hypothetical protein